MGVKSAQEDASWEGKAEVMEVTRQGTRLLIELRWPDDTTTRHDKAVVYKKMPQTMLAYYDSNLVFVDDTTEKPATKPAATKADASAQPASGSKKKATKEPEAADEPEADESPRPGNSATKKAAKRELEPEQKRRESRRSSGSAEPSALKKSKKSTTKEEFFELDKIVDERMRYGKREYRLRWVGFGPSGDTWAPEAHTLEDAPEAVQVSRLLLSAMRATLTVGISR